MTIKRHADRRSAVEAIRADMRGSVGYHYFTRWYSLGRCGIKHFTMVGARPTIVLHTWPAPNTSASASASAPATLGHRGLDREESAHYRAAESAYSGE